MRAMLVGAVESTRLALNAIASSPGWSVAGVLTLPAELSARHSDFVDLEPDAAGAGARLIRHARGNDPEVLDAISEIAPDCTFVIGWSQICRGAFLEAAGHNVVGYHPAPLPQLRGRGVIPWTILLGYSITASTLFWMDEGVDSGPILNQHFLHVGTHETVGSLYARHMEALSAMLAQSLPLIARGDAPRVVQDEQYASWAARRTPADGLIDWTRPSEEIQRLIRAVGRPYPGAFSMCDRTRLTIWSARPWPEATRHAASAGQVIARDATGFAICCGDGRGLWIDDWSSTNGVPRLHARLGIRGGEQDA